ncbi:MAG: SAM-dependent methyltransferase [Calditrichaeota bacterium]|jgi:hypothetical protein|nr:SAM-dependent methyltransferase [Calditrichota bacterium]MBT7616821.1 SAM-dependent methyltransferase [Calditrichota bacterium]MBT7788814.1 SAM-dependent methyltransferase [Calditrichota bacterium]
MLLDNKTQESLKTFFQEIRLLDKDNNAGSDKSAKIAQILAFLEVFNSLVRNYSRKRELVFVDCGAGNCYLSYLVYYFYSHIEGRRIRIHCIDNNERLMEKNSQTAKKFEFDGMFFYGCDIADYKHSGQPDMVYSLHACDKATDKMLFLGIETEAKNILSVSCCQHTIRKQLKGHPYIGMTRHRVFKERLSYMIGDSIRALLVEMQGYKVDMIDFVSSRATDKNVMLRARKGQTVHFERLAEEYFDLHQTFSVVPALEEYLSQSETTRILPWRIASKAS